MTLNHINSSESEKAWTHCLCIMITAAFMLVPDLALADPGGTAIEKVLCNVVKWVTGGVGKAIATIAVIIIGIGALMGKVSWGMAIIVAIGIGVVFGAGSIVGMLDGGGGSGTCQGGAI